MVLFKDNSLHQVATLNYCIHLAMVKKDQINCLLSQYYC